MEATIIPDKYSFLLKEPGPKMLLEGLKLYGEHEIPGRLSNEKILNMARVTGVGKVFKNDDTAWCSLFHRYLAHQAGKSYSGTTLMAKSWVKWGSPVSVPELGDTLIFWRGKKNGPQGHIGLYVGEDSTAYHVLGGNQADSISITRIAKTRLYASRHMYNQKPQNVRRVYFDAKGSVSENEV